MDPLTLSLLGSAAVGTGQAIASAIPSRAERENRKRLEELRRRQKQGALGLEDDEQQVLYRQQMDPVRSGLGQMQTDTERMAAAGGMQTGADLARGRMERGTALGRAATGAVDNVQRAHAEERRIQEQEIEDRQAAQEAARRRRMDTIFGTLGEAAGAAGALAGAPPSTQLAGIAGTPVADYNAFRGKLTESGFQPNQIRYLEQLERQSPGQLSQILYDTIYGGPMADPRLRQLLGGVSDLRDLPLGTLPAVSDL